MPAQSAEATIGQLEALTGQYTDPVDPDTPLSVYVLNGKLYFESERNVPLELKPVSNNEFSISDSNSTLRFTLDANGRGDTVIFTSDPDNSIYHRTGMLPRHHLFHDYHAH